MEGTTEKAGIEEFEAIYNRYCMRVYSFFAKRLAIKEVCEDLTSDVFYSCFKKYDSYDPSKASVATWIFSVANNKLKNYYRDKKEHVSIDDEEIIINLSSSSDMETAVYLTQMKAHLKAALESESISDRERTIVQLRFNSGLTSEEIAMQVGTTAGNVRVILNRTLKKLAEYFRDNGIRWE